MYFKSHTCVECKDHDNDNADATVVFTTSVKNGNYFKNQKASIYIGVYFKTMLLDSFIMNEIVPAKFYKMFGNKNCVYAKLESKLDTSKILIDQVVEHPINFAEYNKIKQLDDQIIDELQRKHDNNILGNADYILELKDKRLQTIKELQQDIKTKNVLDQLTIKVHFDVIE